MHFLGWMVIGTVLFACGQLAFARTVIETAGCKGMPVWSTNPLATQNHYEPWKVDL